MAVTACWLFHSDNALWTIKCETLHGLTHTQFGYFGWVRCYECFGVSIDDYNKLCSPCRHEYIYLCAVQLFSPCRVAIPFLFCCLTCMCVYFQFYDCAAAVQWCKQKLTTAPRTIITTNTGVNVIVHVPFGSFVHRSHRHVAIIRLAAIAAAAAGTSTTSLHTETIIIYHKPELRSAFANNNNNRTSKWHCSLTNKQKANKNKQIIIAGMPNSPRLHCVLTFFKDLLCVVYYLLTAKMLLPRQIFFQN